MLLITKIKLINRDVLTHISIIIPIGLLRKSLRTENRAHHYKKLTEYISMH